MRRQPSSPARFLALVGPTVALGTVVLGGCGSRGPLDDLATNVVLDAGIEAGDEDADAGPAPFDAGREAGVIACGTCVVRTCSRPILACIQSDSCRAVFQCAATTCLGGAGLSPACLFQCAGDNPGGAAGVLAILQCVTGQCGPDCNALLGGLGGLGGGFGGGGGPGGGGPGGPGGGAPAFREIFSPWPELSSSN